jgi:hypothetical protein
MNDAISFDCGMKRIRSDIVVGVANHLPIPLHKAPAWIWKTAFAGQMLAILSGHDNVAKRPHWAGSRRSTTDAVQGN